MFVKNLSFRKCFFKSKVSTHSAGPLGRNTVNTCQVPYPPPSFLTLHYSTSGVDIKSVTGNWSRSRNLQQEVRLVGGVGAHTHRVEPELDNGGIVELINLAAHWDETVAVLNFFDVLLPRCLCCYFTQHCLDVGGQEGLQWTE